MKGTARAVIHVPDGIGKIYSREQAGSNHQNVHEAAVSASQELSDYLDKFSGTGVIDSFESRGYSLSRSSPFQSRLSLIVASPRNDTVEVDSLMGLYQIAPDQIVVVEEFLKAHQGITTFLRYFVGELGDLDFVEKIVLSYLEADIYSPEILNVSLYSNLTDGREIVEQECKIFKEHFIKFQEYNAGANVSFSVC